MAMTIMTVTMTTTFCEGDAQVQEGLAVHHSRAARLLLAERRSDRNGCLAAILYACLLLLFVVCYCCLLLFLPFAVSHSRMCIDLGLVVVGCGCCWLLLVVVVVCYSWLWLLLVVVGRGCC